MLSGGINVLVSQDICHQINISGFPVQIGTEGAAKLVWRDFLEGGHIAGVFLDQIFHSTNGDAAILKGEKQRIFMTLQRNDQFPFLEISQERFPGFMRKLNDRIVSAFSVDSQTIVVKIQILQIDSHTFRNTNTGAQKQGDQCHVTKFGFLMKGFLLPGQLLTAFHNVQHGSNLIGLEPDDFMLMKLGHIDQNRRIVLNFL